MRGWALPVASSALALAGCGDASSTWTLRLDVVGLDGAAGDVEVDGDACADACAYPDLPADGAPLSLRATPEDGSGFVAWSGDCRSSDAALDVYGGADMVVDCTATFGVFDPATEWYFAVAVVGDGSVEIDPANAYGIHATCEDECRLAVPADVTDPLALLAIPDGGDRFIGWTGACSDTTPDTTIRAGAGEAHACTAHFEAGDLAD